MAEGTGCPFCGAKLIWILELGAHYIVRCTGAETATEAGSSACKALGFFWRGEANE